MTMKMRHIASRSSRFFTGTDCNAIHLKDQELRYGSKIGSDAGLSDIQQSRKLPKRAFDVSRYVFG